MQGNEAVAEGALASGCTFFAGYPITPSSEISEYLSKKLPSKGGVFIQMEDEIGSIGAVVGASLAGAKSLTATSGPGFSLMQEMIGYAIAVEAPCVIVSSMRGGPSTGLPTSPSQGDVMQARWGTHGDHPAIVLSASSVQGCFDSTINAFNFAEKLRTPVILLIDEVISHVREKVEIKDTKEINIVDRVKANSLAKFVPYENTGRGVPAFAEIGSGLRHHITGIVHNEKGFPSKNFETNKLFIERIHRKVKNAYENIQLINTFKTSDAEIIIICYGSVTKSALEAANMAREKGKKVGVIELITLYPFPRIKIEKAINNPKLIIVAEMNMGQISREVKRIIKSPINIKTLNRFDGKLITPGEILYQIR